jgi:SAM-dependent methyltransferase
MMTMSHACRACNHPITPFLSLGELPLANALMRPDAPPDSEERFPLTLAVCPQCHLVQLAESIDPERLFRHYVYQTSNAISFVNHARDLARRMVTERALDAGSRVIEIASNDGYLLRHYRDAGVPVLGIEPARNIAEVARAHGIETITEFFTPGVADSICRSGRQADVVHAHNVLAHVPDLHGFVAGMATILHRDGVVVIEVPYLVDLIEKLEFDTLYHEHRCYFGLTPLVPLFARHGLEIVRVERIPVHGGSLRVFARHAGAGSPDESVTTMLSAEREWGALDIGTLRRFADDVAAYRPVLRDFLQDLRAGGKAIAAYGASARGATLLNYCGIDHQTIAFVADRSPLKQGFALPGARVPVVPAEQLLARQPEFALLLAWNFADEVLAQQAEYRARGGRFILPLPRPMILKGGKAAD